MARIPTLGVHTGLQKTSIAELRSLWQHAESLGVGFLSIWDHFYSADLTGPECLEAVTTHTALAMTTKTARVGALVYSIGYRHPAVLAKAIAAIDELSGGRAEIGLGCGWHKPEYDAFGFDFPPVGTRMDQLEEATQCVRQLLHSNEPVNFDGRHFRLTDARLEPRPVQTKLPITIGGGGEKRTLAIAARHADIWNVPFISPAEFARKRAILHQHCDQIGRDPAEITCGINVGLASDDDHLRAQFGITAEFVRPGVLMGTDEHMKGMIDEYVDAGAHRIILAIRAPFQPELIDRFVNVARIQGETK